MTPRNPLPDWYNIWKRGENLCKKEDRKYLMPWWFPKGSPFWWRRRFSTTTSVSGDVRPRTRRRGQNTSYSSTDPCDSANHIWCTAFPSRRASWGDIGHLKNCARHANTELSSGRTGTSQWSHYQIEISNIDTVGTDDCDHERHEGATEDTRFCKNQPIKAIKEALLLELLK